MSILTPSVVNIIVVISTFHFPLTTSLNSTNLRDATISPFLGQEERNNSLNTRVTKISGHEEQNNKETVTIQPFMGQEEERNNDKLAISTFLGQAERNKETLIILGQGERYNETFTISPFLEQEEQSNDTRTRLKKCCPKGQVLFQDKFISRKEEQTESKYFCVQETNHFELSEEHSWEIFKSQHDSEPIFSQYDVDEIGARIPNCTNLQVLQNGEEIWFRILENGEIYVGLHFWVNPIWLRVTKEAGYCLDFNAQANFQRVTQALIFCDLDDYQTYRLHRLLYGVTFTVSATFLTFTVVIFLLVKRGLGPNIHSWLQFSYFFSLLLFYVVEGARIWVKFDGLYIKLGAACFYHAVVSQYFSLVFIFTLFSMAAHMLYTFWKMKPLNSARKRPKGRDIIFLILLPWIIPFLGLLGGLIYNHFTNVKASQQEVGIFEFGHFRCASPAWFVGTALYTLFFILNTIYFIATAAVISATIYKSGRKKLASDTFRLLLKVCLLMGIFFGSTIYEISFGREAVHPLHPLWAFSRIAFFGLQGVWLFFAFGWSSGHRTALGCTSLQDVINMVRRISFKRRGTVSTTADGTTASNQDCDAKSV